MSLRSDLKTRLESGGVLTWKELTELEVPLAADAKKGFRELKKHLEDFVQGTGTYSRGVVKLFQKLPLDPKVIAHVEIANEARIALSNNEVTDAEQQQIALLAGQDPAQEAALSDIALVEIMVPAVNKWSEEAAKSEEAGLEARARGESVQAKTYFEQAAGHYAIALNLAIAAKKFKGSEENVKTAAEFYDLTYYNLDLSRLRAAIETVRNDRDVTTKWRGVLDSLANLAKLPEAPEAVTAELFYLRDAIAFRVIEGGADEVTYQAELTLLQTFAKEFPQYRRADYFIGRLYHALAIGITGEAMMTRAEERKTFFQNAADSLKKFLKATPSREKGDRARALAALGRILYVQGSSIEEKAARDKDLKAAKRCFEEAVKLGVPAGSSPTTEECQTDIKGIEARLKGAAGETVINAGEAVPFTITGGSSVRQILADTRGSSTREKATAKDPRDALVELASKKGVALKAAYENAAKKTPEIGNSELAGEALFEVNSRGDIVDITFPANIARFPVLVENLVNVFKWWQLPATDEDYNVGFPLRFKGK